MQENIVIGLIKIVKQLINQMSQSVVYIMQKDDYQFINNHYFTNVGHALQTLRRNCSEYTILCKGLEKIETLFMFDDMVE